MPVISLHCLLFFCCSFIFFLFALSHTCSHMTHQVSPLPSSSFSFSHLLSHSLPPKHTYMLFLSHRLFTSLCSFCSVPAQHIFIQLLFIKIGLDFTFTVCLQRENMRVGGRRWREKRKGQCEKSGEKDEEIEKIGMGRLGRERQKECLRRKGKDSTLEEERWKDWSCSYLKLAKIQTHISSQSKVRPS